MRKYLASPRSSRVTILLSCCSAAVHIQCSGKSNTFQQTAIAICGRGLVHYGCRMGQQGRTGWSSSSRILTRRKQDTGRQSDRIPRRWHSGRLTGHGHQSLPVVACDTLPEGRNGGRRLVKEPVVIELNHANIIFFVLSLTINITRNKE